MSSTIARGQYSFPEIQVCWIAFVLDTGNSREGRARDRSPGSLICPCRRESNKPHSFRAHSCRRQRRARLRTEDARSESPSSAPPKARADQSTSGGRPDSVRRRARRRGLRCHPNRSPARHRLGRLHRMQRLAVGGSRFAPSSCASRYHGVGGILMLCVAGTPRASPGGLRNPARRKYGGWQRR